MFKALWAKVIVFIAKLFGAGTVPPEVTNGDTLIATWASIYQANASWLPFNYITADGVKRNRKRFSLNSAKIVCSEMAGLVLSETPGVVAGALVDDLLVRERFWDNLRQNLEIQGALGGQVLKIYVSGGQIHLDFVKAQNFIPLAWDNARVTEASFLDRRLKGKDSYVRVETHKRIGGGYRITSSAFSEETGLEVSLDAMWPDVAPSVDVMVDEPLFVYCKNPEANNFNTESPLGISLFANAVDTLQALDLAFDGMKTEVLMGRQRVALPGIVMRGYMDPETGKHKLGFDPTDEAYIRLEGDDADKMKPTSLTGELRMEQWKMAIQTCLNLLAVQCGFDAGYFSFDGVSMKTATEVISENSHTYKTMMAYRDVLKGALEHLFRVVNKVGALNSMPGASAALPQITFDDGVIEDRNSRAKYHEDLVQNKLEDRVSAIKAIHGLNEKDALAMAEKIKSETAVVTNAGIFGLEGGNQ